MIQKIKIIKTLIIIFSLCFPFNANAQTVEEIKKGRKAMFSENYQNAKKISILLKSKKIEEAKPLMKKASDDMIKLAKAIETAEDLRAAQKELMWSNCSACHSKFRAPH